MKHDETPNPSSVNRRSFLRNAGGTTLAVAAMAAAPQLLRAEDDDDDHKRPKSPDTPPQIFTAALIAEDLATTFYYNGLKGNVIQDVNLAGPGGSATHITAVGSASNVGYIRAALSEEIAHANLFRALLGKTGASTDPYQTFYFADGVFDSLTPFIATLEALENAFIGAYLAAVQEFSLLASIGEPRTFGGVRYKPSDFAYFAKVAASILGVESEHRALGRAIVPTIIPANQLNYEQTDGITSVFNGKTSAAAALTPFLSHSSGTMGYSLSAALAGASSVTLPTTGGLPA